MAAPSGRAACNAPASRALAASRPQRAGQRMSGPRHALRLSDWRAIGRGTRSPVQKLSGFGQRGHVKVHHADFEIELPDAWWQEAGMQDFVPSAQGYAVDDCGLPINAVQYVPIADIAPVRRQLSHRVFNDLHGLSARERVLQILRGFLRGDALPPLEVKHVGGQAPCDRHAARRPLRLRRRGERRRRRLLGRADDRRVSRARQ
jgi:hypothetical protein